MAKRTSGKREPERGTGSAQRTSVTPMVQLPAATPAAQPLPAAPQLAQPPLRRAADFKYIYANNCNLRPAAFDFAFTFTQIREAPEGGGLINEEQVSVVVSPQHFKAIAKQFNDALKQYEAINGELKMAGAQVVAPDVRDRLQQIMDSARTKAIETLKASLESASSAQPPPLKPLPDAGKPSKKKP